MSDPLNALFGAGEAMPVAEPIIETPVVPEAPPVEAAPEPVAPVDVAPPAVEPEPKPVHTVPLNALLDTREKLAEERRKREDAERQFAETQRQLQALQQQAAAPSQPLSERLYANPEAVFDEMRRELAQRQELAVDAMQMAMAKQLHGAVVDEAMEALRQRADAAFISQQFRQTPDPYGALVTWHKREKLLSEIGDDPDAYVRKRYEALISQATAPAPVNGAAPSAVAPPAPPPSLAASPSKGSAGAIATGPGVAFDALFRR